MAIIWFCEPAESELKRFSQEDQQKVSDAVFLLGNDDYRNQNKLNLNLIEHGFNIYSLLVGRVWLAFHEDSNGDVRVDWVSLRSRFRP
jgi:mRNA-degrading endonuclease RelE of RelBE toxin-antitoxin system